MANTLQPKALYSLLHKYRHIFGKYRLPVILGVVCLGVTNALGIAIPWQIKTAVDTLQHIDTQTLHDGAQTTAQTAALWHTFNQSLWLIAVFATLVLLARVASRQLLLGAGRRLEFDLRNALYAHFLRMPLDYYAAHPPGELMSRITNDVDATKSLTGGGIMLGVNTVLVYVLVVPTMLVLNWKLALVTFLLYPAMIWVMTRISKKVRRGFYEVQEILASISTMAHENLNGMTVIQSYVREDQEKSRFEAVCEHYFGTYTKLIHERILLFMVLAGLSGFSMLVVLLMGGWEVIGKQLDWGGFVAFTMYLEQLAWPTMALGWTISIFQQGTAALERIDEVLSTESNLKPGEVLSTESSLKPIEELSTEADLKQGAVQRGESAGDGAVELRHLTFAYHNVYYKEATAPHPALQDIDLQVRPGETLALVGPVGSGKSTLLRLLPRLHDVPTGTIFLNGRDITTLPLAELRRQIVFMPQMSFLFSSTVSQNIAFGQPDMLTHELEDSIIPAAVTAGVHHDILALPGQYETLVGERGLMLSGGQRQRVALARAILLDAPVLVLDDPFSNVDAETERRIVEAMRERRLLRDRMTLIATHRFSLISLCDRIALLDEGRLLAVGTHEELMASQPLYQKLHHLQELRSTLAEWEIGSADTERTLANSLAEEDDA